MNKLTLPLINLDYLKMICDGDMDMEKTMIEMLISELPLEFEQMKLLFRDSNWQELGALSHKMKSTLAFVGNDELTDANKEIELICKDKGDTGKIALLLAVMQKDFEDTVQQLKEELERV